MDWRNTRRNIKARSAGLPRPLFQKQTSPIPGKDHLPTVENCGITSQVMDYVNSSATANLEFPLDEGTLDSETGSSISSAVGAKRDGDAEQSSRLQPSVSAPWSSVALCMSEPGSPEASAYDYLPHDVNWIALEGNGKDFSCVANDVPSLQDIG